MNARKRAEAAIALAHQTIQPGLVIDPKSMKEIILNLAEAVLNLADATAKA
jgi:hypothetical protein